jgi:hypothetical protein
MKLVKSLLLGSAAGLMAVTGAQAADLPVRKAAPVVDYVRVCSAYGAGFFFIPGTETCLRVSGRVRAEYTVGETYRRNFGESAFNWRARGQLNLDARTQTAYGTLRTFIRYELTRNVGNYYGTANVNGGLTTDLNKAFIQFAGITAGRATSFFDFYAGAIIWGSAFHGSDTYGVDPVVLAYTASFGSGISATVSLEDPTARRRGVIGTPGAVIGFVPGPGVAGFQEFRYDQDQRPHLVGQLRIDQAWGSAQLSGALYQLRSANRFQTVTGVTEYADTDYGFAIQGGLKINLPMIAAGDQLWLQAAYSNGSLGYITPGLVGATNVGGFNLGNVADAYVIGNTGDVERTKGFSLVAAFLHYWTPQIRQGLYAGWTHYDVPSEAVTTVVAPGFAPGSGFLQTGAVVDTNVYEIGTNLIWSPVAGLDIGVEVLYRKAAARNGRIQINETLTPGVVGATTEFKRSEDQFQARLRIQRDF